MAIKTSKGYKCGYCNKIYITSPEADRCKDSHQLIYIALSVDDLNRLVNFIYLKEEKLLSESLVETLQKYLKNSRKKDAKA
jgi:hypothetical protein